MAEKKITQIITYYNEEKYIAECIRSLLNQTYQNLEIIAISDGSTDRGPEIVASFDDPRIIMINNPDNHGQGYCRNQGLDIATGDYVGFFDGDDISYPNRIEVLADFLDDNQGIFCVSCRSQYIDATGNEIPTDIPPVVRGVNNIKAEFLFGCPVACSCALFRKSLIDKYQLREIEQCKTAEDYHFWLQCLQYGDFQNIDRDLFYYRQHASQSKKEVASNKSRHAIWMIDTFEYAWKSRGFDISREYMEIIYYYFASNRLMWNPIKVFQFLIFWGKIKWQMCSRMKLDEDIYIKEAFKERAFIFIPYFYPVKIMVKGAHKLIMKYM